MGSRSTIEIEVISDPRVLTKLGDEFDHLQARVGSSLTQSRRWLEAWVDAAADEPHAVVARERGSGEMVGVALLGVQRTAGVLRLRGLGHGLSDHTSFPVVDRAAAEALADGIVGWLSQFRRPWTLHLDHVVEGDLGVECLARLLPAHRWEAGMPSPWTVIDGDRSLEAHTSARLRRNRRQALKKLEKGGHRWDITRRHGDEITPALLEQIEEIRRSRDDDIGILSELDTRTGTVFWQSIMETFASSGELMLHVLEIDGQMAVYTIGFRDGSTWRMWDSRIHPSFAHHSPGLLLHVSRLEAALADRTVTDIDWGRGESPAKRRLANGGVRASFDLHGWSSHRLRRFDAAIAAARARLVAVKNSNERVRRAWLAVRARTR